MVAKDFQGSTTVTLPSSPENRGEFAVTIMDLLLQMLQASKGNPETPNSNEQFPWRFS